MLGQVVGEQPHRIELWAGTVSSEFAFEVEDSGIGMSESEIARIYRPFVQADLSITRKYGGSGLGLAICKQLVEGMHGLIEVRSRPGEGTCFGVRLTLALATESDLPDGDKAPEVQTLPTHYHDARVLVVDDQPLNREIVFDLLAQVGIVPRFAENGLEAINILSQCGPEAFDLVLMDIQMPVIDGLTATRRVRALPGFATLPIAAMTAHTMEHEKQMYLDEGMNDHLGKPFALPSFFALLARWLAHRAEAPPVPTAPVASVECGSDGDGELSEIGGLDASAARQRFAGNEARYRYWLREFVGDSADFIARLDALLRDREYAAARQMVHAFKGRVGTLGMTELHDLAAALEQLLRASEAGGETDGTPDSHRDNNYGSAIRPQLVQSIERMRVSLQAALGSGRPVTVAAAARPEGPMPPAIAALLPLLEASDGGSAAAIAACLADLPDRDWQAPLQAALAKAEGFDFEAAKLILAEMIRAPT
nr:response regulator [Candidatus Accumulibacter phosphatis]